MNAITTPYAIVVLSGGQDSMTVLAKARSECARVDAITFDYGQRHDIEMDCAAMICARWNVKFDIYRLGFLSKLVKSALLDSHSDVSAKHPRLSHLPASFVPSRNAMFLTIAHAIAQERGADRVYAGMCQTDYSGYPDCRDRFIDALQKALNIGYESDIAFHTPLMYLNKAETFEMAEKLDCLPEILELSHTCYNGKRDAEHRHDWGYGCGECPACQLRAKGWAAYREARARDERFTSAAAPR